MELPHISIGNVSISRLIIGGNPFSGVSHQGIERDKEMLHFFTAERIKQTLNEAESNGIETFLGRADRHIVRILSEYRDDGGSMQWLGQTCPEMQSIARSVQDAIDWGATAVYIHGGVMDYLLANGGLETVPPAIDMIRKAGLPAGIAGHNPKVFEWAEKNLDLDFYLCSYYNSAHRDANAEHIHGRPEWFNDDDRAIMTSLIQTLSKPVIHYKVLAAGRKKPEEGLAFAAQNMRKGDAVCVGVFPKDNPEMIRENIDIFLANLKN